MDNLHKILETSRNEKDVENNYREYFNVQLRKLSAKDPNIGTITSPYKTDGLLKYINKDRKINLNCLFEFKYDIDMNNRTERTRVIIQALYYLKKFEIAGEFFLPTTIFIGDKNECFYFHTNNIIKYLGYKLDWNIAPSEAGYRNDSLLMEMIQDTNLDNVYIIDIDGNFKFMDILKNINEITSNTKSRFRITNQNVHIILANFVKKVLNDKKLSVNDEVNLFIQSLVDRTNNYQHPNKPNVLVTKGFGDIKIFGAGYKSYINFFDTDLSPSEKETLTATQDRLIQDETRRKQGEFFTPTIWVNEAHKMISETFGEDWKEKFVTWDCASGTGNLTRDYQFKELYCSTLVGSDIETMTQAGYNPEATKFQYDFLNDGVVNGQIDILNDPKLPEGLKKAILEGKEIIIFMNSPYGAATEFGEKSKKNVAKTKTSELMKKDDWGASSQQLYAQFLYKCYILNKNKNIHLAFFAKSLYKTGSSWKKFRNNFYKKFNYIDGMLFNASHFSDTSDTWGVDFSIWKSGEEKRNSLSIKIKDENLAIIEILSKKEIYNLDKSTEASKWVRRNIKKLEVFDAPQMKSGLNVKFDGKTMVGKISKNALGYFLNGGNFVYTNNKMVNIFSSCFAVGHGLSIVDKNFMDVVSLFSARRLTINNWINDKDEYIAPDEKNILWNQFQNDSIIYSLFNTSSSQSSMRQIEYKDKLWDIKNEFFFMSKDEMKALAEQYKFDELYKDTRNTNERYVFELLKTINLSPDAEKVLEKAKELVRKSFEWRKIMYQSNPEYHLDAWDAGWYQIKKILNEHFKLELNEFNALYKSFENRMRPQVYQLGFLKDDERLYDEEYQKKLADARFESFNLNDNLSF